MARSSFAANRLSTLSKEKRCLRCEEPMGPSEYARFLYFLTGVLTFSAIAFQFITGVYSTCGFINCFRYSYSNLCEACRQVPQQPETL